MRYLLFCFLFILLSGCTTTQFLDTLSKINQERTTISPHGCTEDQILWCEGHDRQNSECMCVDRDVMQDRLRNQMQTITIW